MIFLPGTGGVNEEEDRELGHDGILIQPSRLGREGRGEGGKEEFFASMGKRRDWEKGKGKRLDRLGKSVVRKRKSKPKAG